MSQRKVQNTIVYLELRGLVKRIGFKLGGEKHGNYYQVLIPGNVPANDPNTTPGNGDETESGCLAPHTSLAPHATVARGATNKDDDDKNKK